MPLTPQVCEVFGGSSLFQTSEPEGCPCHWQQIDGRHGTSQMKNDTNASGKNVETQVTHLFTLILSQAFKC